MRRLAPHLVALAALAFVATAGRPTLAKLAYLAGLPQVASALTDSPAVKGAMLYETGNYAAADAQFAAIGSGATYDRAATLALTGDYSLSVAYYDAVLFADRWDADARQNREIISAFVTPVVGEAMGHGRIDRLIAQSGARVAGFSAEAPTDPTVIPDDRLGRPTTASATVADADWLQSLADAPGEYLVRRLAAEQQRRLDEGLAYPPEPSPW